MTHDGRTWHYRHFYDLPDAEPVEAAPLWVVVGNCQAEALRLVLDAVADRPYRTVRIPPVHELESSDMPHLAALLSRATALLAQPIREDYRELPLGTAQLASMLPPSARVVRWPVIRYAGLYPFQVIVRHPADRSVNPPAVPYHDLRTVAAARSGRSPREPWDVDTSAAQFRANADASVAALAARERRDTDVAVSDVLAAQGADACHAINHPGNSVLAALAERILAAMDVPAAVTPLEQTLLRSVYVPLESRVLDALGIVAEPRPGWLLDGRTLRPDSVHETQLRWYADNPDYLELTVDRHGATMELLGLPTGRR
ncbi:WcbI family polysaccharide biosynthesis putative acetyltransferase [Mycolicibacterium sediminis]|uniref:Polysaccharide biosynthesis enzyme WcbI domain-containing protein n=1 Tax=Mycolicibacterium sediminis TaxID=1286180 RepID=A0A7I7QYL0_9MYCO|nr:WcbI family polysaccharide biosynthesis putative acetyltransferase [Mycolicibacterium sediminis]BBY31473.1 hypothetical protein MSEDJ_55690 [Mycolicibacterium sediminis]